MHLYRFSKFPATYSITLWAQYIFLTDFTRAFHFKKIETESACVGRKYEISGKTRLTSQIEYAYSRKRNKYQKGKFLKYTGKNSKCRGIYCYLLVISVHYTTT